MRINLKFQWNNNLLFVLNANDFIFVLFLDKVVFVAYNFDRNKAYLEFSLCWLDFIMSGFSVGFNGTYRRTPTVSFRGNSKTETKEQLLERAKKDRIKREVRSYTLAHLPKLNQNLSLTPSINNFECNSLHFRPTDYEKLQRLLFKSIIEVILLDKNANDSYVQSLMWCKNHTISLHHRKNRWNLKNCSQLNC